MSCRPLAFTLIVFAAALFSCTGPARAQATQSQTEDRTAHLRVLLELVDAELLVDDSPTRQKGTRRSFVSPPLEMGKKYYYTLTATMRPNNYTTITRVRKVLVEAGKTVEVDLRKSDDKQPDKIVIRYVPTPEEIVDAMLKLADVGKDDVVYDLGCGDGRIVIRAVEKFGAKRGVGVDLDPQRIKESRANARAAKVENRVEFRQGDVFEVKDLADATVVTLYMGDELNLMLRPILRKTLKPGTRIVSHRFTMGDWKPLKTQSLVGYDGDTYLIHLWKITKEDAGKK
jgi:uncharacterized protein (TIGR03000 family)